MGNIPGARRVELKRGSRGARTVLRDAVSNRGKELMERGACAASDVEDVVRQAVVGRASGEEVGLDDVVDEAEVTARAAIAEPHAGLIAQQMLGLISPVNLAAEEAIWVSRPQAANNSVAIRVK